MRQREAPLVVRGKGASVPRSTLLTPFEVTNLVHGHTVHSSPSAVDSARVPDIIEFVMSPQFLDKPLLYPRQGTILKVATLRDDLLTEFDLDLIGRWEDTFRQTGNEGISPGVLDRIRINKAAGRSWFRELDVPVGRRGGKGHIGGLLGAYVLWNYMHRPGGPQEYYGIDRDKRLSAITFAGKKEQAIANQWRDLTNTIASGPCFAPYISRHLGSIMTVMAPTDMLRIQKQQLSGVDTENDPATFEILPSASTLMAGRGPASFMQHFDEMAHIIATGSNRDAEAIYSSATPSLDQFGVDGFIYAGSSPWHMQGQFYKNCQQAVQMDEDGTPSYPEMLLVQLPSWGPYEDWDRAESIPLVPSKSVSIDLKPSAKGSKAVAAKSTQAVRKYPYIKRPIQVYDDQMRQLEKANPDTFKVERRSHWSEALDAYLNPDRVREAFAGEDGIPRRMNQRGPLTTYYAAHGDPAKVGDNFGFAIAHTEPGDESTYGLPYVVFDVLHAWKPSDFEDHSIDYGVVQMGLERYIKRFTIEHLTFDQWNSIMVIGRLNEFVKDHGFTKSISIYERTATAQTNWREAETFKAALNMGLIKAPTLDEDGKESEAAELAELELRFLHEKNGRVDHQTSGPVQTKDVADSMMAVTYHLIGAQMGEYLKTALGTPMLGMSAQGGTNSPETRAGGRNGTGDAIQRMSQATRRGGSMGAARGMARRGR